MGKLFAVQAAVVYTTEAINHSRLSTQEGLLRQHDLFDNAMLTNIMIQDFPINNTANGTLPVDYWRT